MAYENLISNNLDIPFKDFTAGQVIQSSQFNDDLNEIQDKVNEIIEKYNLNSISFQDHTSDSNNPHNVTSDQVGAYSIEDIDLFLDDIRNGHLNEKSLGNELFKDESVDTRVIKTKSIKMAQLDDNVGNELDISLNTEITNRYTKEEVDDLLSSKVGEGTYSKEEINDMFADVQAGQIVDSTIGVEKLKSDVGKLLNISENEEIINRYTVEEVNSLVDARGLPRDWGDLSSLYTSNGILPIANVMTAGEFIVNDDDLFDIVVKEVYDARSGYPTLLNRLTYMQNEINALKNNVGGGGTGSVEIIFDETTGNLQIG